MKTVFQITLMALLLGGVSCSGGKDMKKQTLFMATTNELNTYSLGAEYVSTQFRFDNGRQETVILKRVEVGFTNSTDFQSLNQGSNICPQVTMMLPPLNAGSGIFNNGGGEVPKTTRF